MSNKKSTVVDPNKSYDQYKSRDRTPEGISRSNTVVRMSPPKQGHDQSLRYSGLDQQTKFNLYTEIERLTVLNLDLKTQNEGLLREIDKQTYHLQQFPVMEAKIGDLERELSRKDAALSQSLRDNDFLRKDLLNLQKIEPAYNEIFAHNKRLINEIDDLNNQLERALRDRERLELELSNLASTQVKLNDAYKRIEDLVSDNEDKQKEIFNLKDQLKNANEKIRVMNYESDRLQNNLSESQREVIFLRNRQNSLEKDHADQYIHLTEAMDAERKAHQQEKIDLTTKHLNDKTQYEGELKSAHNRIEELHHKLTLMVNENEKLQKLNLEASREIDLLNRRLYQTQQNAEETQDQLEKDRRSQLDEQAKELTLQIMNQGKNYEERIAILKRDINQLEKLKDVIAARENDIQNLKRQNAENEKAWERKQNNTVDTEKNNMLVKFNIEKNALQNELNSARDRIADLENQLHLMTIEVERLANLHQEKEQEIHEHKQTLHIQTKEADNAFENLKASLIQEKESDLQNLEASLKKVYEAKLDELHDNNIELENKIVLLAEENAKLLAVNDERLKEIENLNYRLAHQEEKTVQTLQDIERKHENVLKFSVSKEVSSVQSRNNAEIANLEAKIAELNKQIQGLEDKCKFYLSEIDRLNGIINQKHEEINDEKLKRANLNTEKNQQIAALKSYFDTLRAANIELNEAGVRFDAERAGLLATNQQLREKIDELDRRLGLLTSENEKLRNLYNQKIEDLENMRKHIVEVQEKFDRQRHDLEGEIDLLKFARLDLQEANVKLNSEKAQLEATNKQLKTQWENVKVESEYLQATLDQLKKDQQAQIATTEALRHELNSCHDLLRKTTADVDTEKDRCEHERNRADTADHDRGILTDKLTALDDKLNRTNQDLLNKINDVENVRKKYEKSLEVTTQLNTQLLNRIKKNE